MSSIVVTLIKGPLSQAILVWFYFKNVMKENTISNPPERNGHQKIIYVTQHNLYDQPSVPNVIQTDQGSKLYKKLI